MPEWLPNLLTGVGSAGVTAICMAWMFLRHLQQQAEAERPFRQQMFDQCHRKHEEVTLKLNDSLSTQANQNAEIAKTLGECSVRLADCADAHRKLQPHLARLAFSQEK